MKIAVGVVTFNATASLRFELLEETVESLRAAFPDDPLVILDNGSDDGSDATIEAMYGSIAQVVHRRGETLNRTPGAGRNRLLAALAATDAELFVMSDDDMRWRPDARGKIGRFFEPDGWDVESPFVGPVLRSLALVGGYLEPVYPWSIPRATLRVGGEVAVIRDSVPGAAWIMRAERARQHPGFPHPFVEDFGYDHKHCMHLSDMSMRVAAMDLAEHLGADHSTHGNRAHLDVRAQPFDRAAWEM